MRKVKAGVWLPAARICRKMLRSGMRVRCSILSRPITDARLRLKGRLEIYICNNVEDGQPLPERLRYGYVYSWVIIPENPGVSLTDACSGDYVAGLRVLFPYCQKEKSR